MIVEYKKPNVYGVPGKTGPVIFIPGSNTIEEEEWNFVKKHPTVQRLLSARFLIEVTTKEGKPVSTITDLSQTEAIALVSRTYDEGLLSSWAVSEERKPVARAIDKQLGRIVVKAKVEKNIDA